MVKKNVIDFLKDERNLSLFERSYNGFYYWQSIRFFVCESLFGTRIADEEKQRQQNRKTFLQNLIILLKCLFKAFRDSFHPIKKAELLILRDTFLSDRMVFDSWCLPENITVSNYRCSSYMDYPRKNENFLEWPRIKSVVIHKLKRCLHLNRIDVNERHFLIELQKKLQNKFGQCISAQEMERAILASMVSDKNYCEAFKKLFTKSRCKAIAFECYYSNLFFSAIKVANELGITVIEFQHGVINNHQEYWFEDRRGLNNYTPDYLLTFGEVHNNWIQLVEGKKAITIGYPFQEKSIEAVRDIYPNEKEIMIYPVSDSRFEEVLDQFTNEITKLGYSVYLKIHPIEAKNEPIYYPVLSQNRNLQVITSQKEGIYYWLKKAKHHIMASTTVGLEAIAFDHCNVCIAEDVPHDQTQCLLDWGVARCFSTVDELKNLILNPLDLTTEEAKKARERLWSSNASTNMTNIFRKFKENNWRL